MGSCAPRRFLLFTLGELAWRAKGKKMETQADEEDLPLYNEDGVDLTLIREMLDLDPIERIRRLESYAASAQELRDAGKAVRLSESP